MSLSKYFIALVAMVIGASSFSSCNAGSATDVMTVTDNTVDAAKVLKLIEKEQALVIDGSHIKGSLHFYDAGTGTRVMEQTPSYIDCEIVFVNCVFEDSVSSSGMINNGAQRIYSVFRRNVSFVGCTFLKNANFSFSSFYGRTAFDKSVFRADLSLEGATFRENVIMNGVQAEGNVQMSGAQFGPSSSFVGMKVAGKALFQNSIFEGRTSFVDTQWGGYLNFAGASSAVLLDFSNAVFGSRVAFEGARLCTLKMSHIQAAENVTLEKCILLGDVSFANSKFDKSLRLLNNRFSSLPNFKGVEKGNNASLVDENNMITSSSVKIDW